MNDDRTWPLPSSPWIMRMQWSELLFAHWPIDADLIASKLPAGLEVDTFGGQAWVGVVPFQMSDVAPRGCPAVPWLSRFLELNVRTYVIKDGKPGVWFYSLDAANPVAVRIARKTFNLPYMDANMSIATKASNGEITYRSDRTHRREPAAIFDATYRPLGDVFHAEPGTLEHWLTARYCLYSANKRDAIYRGEIFHPPWQLRNASWQLRQNTMGNATNFDFQAEPHLLFAAPVDVQAWRPTRC
ncbi:YqjF family protein [Rubripirellula reticaptiva]|uniref:DUF2071 domain-containing protein n=1 Tax=Rubripirellula reticaptiva TaxID=2528013 RepID=A0A5C6FE11_9BACT|nr:DUF2071 domain-containing protein [Rubripirellula reticaptiva]TWU58336.1 hypothetical protein Poly59_12470 [Rubripirellula reticaptiva]